MNEAELYRALWALTRDRARWQASAPRVASLLAHESVKIRAKALWLLGEMGLQSPPSVKPAIPAIAAFCESPEPLLRERAVNALGRIGRGDFSAIEPYWAGLFRLASDEAPGVRLSFIWASENIAVNAPDLYGAHMPAFAALLRDPDDRVRMEAPEIFRVLGKRRPAFVRPYLDALRRISETDANRVVRIHCLGAIRAAVSNPAGRDGRAAEKESGGLRAMDERLKRQLAFALEIDAEKNVFRQTHLSGHGRRENDAEHAWHMAVMAWLLREYANEEVDIARVMLMCLIHDIVEIDAGDTYAYDEAGLKTQKAREDAAKARIFSLLPDDQRLALTELFDEFEAYETAESKFAHSMDNLQPLLLNDSNDGGDWKAHGVTAEAVYGRQRRTRLGSERLYEVTDQIIRSNIRKGNLPER